MLTVHVRKLPGGSGLLEAVRASQSVVPPGGDARRSMNERASQSITDESRLSTAMVSSYTTHRSVDAAGSGGDSREARWWLPSRTGSIRLPREILSNVP